MGKIVRCDIHQSINYLNNAFDKNDTKSSYEKKN